MVLVVRLGVALAGLREGDPAFRWFLRDIMSLLLVSLVGVGFWPGGSCGRVARLVVWGWRF